MPIECAGVSRVAGGAVCGAERVAIVVDESRDATSLKGARTTISNSTVKNPARSPTEKSDQR
jgi:hypothetical protein